jgi:acetylornithine deacetylase/succinyl-diaminopimelate desuccinylase-like protein
MAIAPAAERLMREAAPAGAELEVELWSWSAPGLVPADAPAIRLGLDAFERALGVRPLLIRSGGTLPIIPALGRRGIPAIVTGFALPDSNVHSPNERLLLEYMPLGVRAARGLFTELARLS